MSFMDQRGMAILHVTTRMCLEDKSPIRGSNWPEFVSHLVGPLMCRTRLTVCLILFLFASKLTMSYTGRNHVKLGQAQTWFTQGLGLGHRGGIWTPVMLDVTMY